MIQEVTARARSFAACMPVWRAPCIHRWTAEMCSPAKKTLLPYSGSVMAWGEQTLLVRQEKGNRAAERGLLIPVDVFGVHDVSFKLREREAVNGGQLPLDFLKQDGVRLVEEARGIQIEVERPDENAGRVRQDAGCIGADIVRFPEQPGMVGRIPDGSDGQIGQRRAADNALRFPETRGAQEQCFLRRCVIDLPDGAHFHAGEERRDFDIPERRKRDGAGRRSQMTRRRRRLPGGTYNEG